MDKKQIIGKLFKILPLKEQVKNGKINDEDFKKYINSQYILFSGMTDDVFSMSAQLKSEIILMLHSFLKMDLDIDDIKSILFGVINEIDRRC